MLCNNITQRSNKPQRSSLIHIIDEGFMLHTTSELINYLVY